MEGRICLRAAELRVVGDEPKAGEVLVVGPADEPVPGLAGERSCTEPDDREPAPVATERDVAHRLTDQVMAEPVVLVERFVEADPLAGQDRAHGHGAELGFRHPTRTTRAERKAPVPSRHPWPGITSYDFVVALTPVRAANKGYRDPRGPRAVAPAAQDPNGRTATPARPGDPRPFGATRKAGLSSAECLGTIDHPGGARQVRAVGAVAVPGPGLLTCCALIVG